MAKSRCLIPALGWYEWKQVERTDAATGEIIKAKQPHFFHLPDDQLFAFAGVMATDAAQAMAIALKDGVTTVEHHPVTTRVNIAGNDDEGLVRKVNE